MEKVHIDFIGPLKQSTRGNEHILVIVDQFNKWIETIPLPTQDAETTATAAVTEFFSRFGYPLQLISDQGRNFESTLFKEICKLLQIHKLRTTAYRPSANGQAERQNRTLMAAVRSFVNDDQDNWDEFLPLIASAIRSAVNRQTGFTPNKMMLGRELNTPAEIMFPINNQEPTTTEQHAIRLQNALQEAHQIARDTLKVELKRMKQNYDLKMHTQTYRRGDIVYCINKSVTKGQSSKLKPVWSGPHLIVRALTPYTFKIRIQNREEKVVNHDSIKLCTDRKTSLPNWIVKEQKVITEGQQSLHCICNQPDDGETMIQCSSCYVWFHCECIHLTENQARRTKTFICPICML